MKPESIAYRVRQFAAAILESRRPVDGLILKEYLQSAQIELFLRQSPAMQHHSLRVLRALETGRCQDKAVMQAALMHDVAKTGDVVRLWHRVISVLLEALAPALLERLGSECKSSWRYPFYVQARHADHGAMMSLATGVSQTVADLIREHHTPVSETTRVGLDAERLLLLQWADAEA
jgi:hypothetical protein